MLLKRNIDVAFSAVFLIVLSPVILLAALAVVTTSGRPILFRQKRIGKGFSEFEILKFRTMRNRSEGVRVTVRGDNRITGIGKILRATKIDEIPQFWNVIRGDMSLVGPRPEVKEYVALYKDRYKRVLSVRPGITDPASIQFRNEEELLAQSQDPVRTYTQDVLPVKLDLAEQYIQAHSMYLDLKILFQTVLVTVFPTVAAKAR